VCCLLGRAFHNIKGKAAKHASSFCSGAECFIHGVIHVIEETGVTSDSIEFLHWYQACWTRWNWPSNPFSKLTTVMRRCT
jgi:hypothetical protein